MDPQSEAAATLPPPVAALIDGTGLGDRVGQTISILTVVTTGGRLRRPSLLVVTAPAG